MRKFINKRVAVVVAVVAALAAATSAYAYFTSSGSGDGSATVGSSSTYTVTVNAPTGGALYPEAMGGSHIDTVGFKVKNNGSGNQNVGTVTISIANADGSAWTSVAGCSASDFSLNGAAVGTAVTDSATAGLYTAGQEKTSSVTLEMIDNGASQNGCQGATVPIHVAVS